MDASQTAETQLLNDVEALRVRYPNTQELYREVCTVMFFRYGITPTANRLYQLVRKGSMSAPAEALARFWNTLRERSRVTIEGPDVPEALRSGAGELVSALWQAARREADAALAALREEAGAEAASLRAQLAEANATNDALVRERDAAAAALWTAREDAAGLKQQLGTSEALNAKLRERIDDARRELNEQHAWFKTVERDHAAALDKLRDQLAAERSAAETAQAHLRQELERDRHALARSEQGAAAAAERHRTELREALSEVGALRERLGALESRAAAGERAERELAVLQRELAAAQAQAAAAQGRAAALESALRHVPGEGGPRRPKTRAAGDA